MNKSLKDTINNNHFVYFKSFGEDRDNNYFEKGDDILIVNSDTTEDNKITEVLDIYDNKYFIIDTDTESKFDLIDDKKISKIEDIDVNKIKSEIDKIRDKDTVTNYLDEFKYKIKNENSYIETGIDELDEFFNGGIFNELYVLGAPSAIGKTTFCLQIADNLAKKEHDVMYFTLEQSKVQLISKTLTRINYNKNKESITASDIRKYEGIDENILNDLINHYGNTIGNNMFIHDDIKGLDDIKTRIEKNMRRRNKKPIVFIDYLQIIPSANNITNSKEKIDQIIFKIRKLSNKYNIPIFLISSFNRSSYAQAVKYQSFKESGAIEYTVDVMLGMQYSQIDYTNEEKDIYKKIKSINKSEDRDIDIVMLKNRNGPISNNLKTRFLPSQSLFKGFSIKQ